MDGVIFHCKSRSMMKYFKNSGLLCKANTTYYSSTRENNPVSGDIDYYGILLDVHLLE